MAEERRKLSGSSAEAEWKQQFASAIGAEERRKFRGRCAEAEKPMLIHHWAESGGRFVEAHAEALFSIV